ncbi:MAG: hypothetical protein ACYTG0_37330, partial [Planctomycetota bacterium]
MSPPEPHGVCYQHAIGDLDGRDVRLWGAVGGRRCRVDLPGQKAQQGDADDGRPRGPSRAGGKLCRSFHDVHSPVFFSVFVILSAQSPGPG